MENLILIWASLHLRKVIKCFLVLVILFIIFPLFEYLCEFCVHSAIKVLKVFLCLVKSLWQLVMSVVLCLNLGITVMFSTMFCGAIDHQSKKCWFSSWTRYGAVLNDKKLKKILNLQCSYLLKLKVLVTCVLHLRQHIENQKMLLFSQVYTSLHSFGYSRIGWKAFRHV